MDGEFTGFCRTYYGQQSLLKKLNKRVARMLANALPYTGQTNVSELDEIIQCNRAIQQAKADAEDCEAAMKKTAHALSKILAYFNIPPLTRLTCTVPGEFELQLWMDDDKTINCIKTKDLNPLADDPSIIVIKLVKDPFDFEEDD